MSTIDLIFDGDWAFTYTPSGLEIIEVEVIPPDARNLTTQTLISESKRISS